MMIGGYRLKYFNKIRCYVVIVKYVFTAEETVGRKGSTVIHESSRTALEYAAFHLGTYLKLYSFESAMKRPFLGIPSFKVNIALLSQVTLNPRYAKNVITNAHYGARKLSCLFPKSW